MLLLDHFLSVYLYIIEWILRYEDKKWASKDMPQPSPIASESCDNYNKSVEGGLKVPIPKKARKYSLEEETITKHLSQVPPPISRPRAVCLFSFMGYHFLL